MEFSEQLASDAAATAAIIDDILRTEQSSAQRLREAMLHAALSGGTRLSAQRAKLASGVDLLVATPSRLRLLLRRQKLLLLLHGLPLRLQLYLLLQL